MKLSISLLTVLMCLAANEGRAADSCEPKGCEQQRQDLREHIRMINSKYRYGDVYQADDVQQVFNHWWRSHRDCADMEARRVCLETCMEVNEPIHRLCVSVCY